MVLSRPVQRIPQKGERNVPLFFRCQAPARCRCMLTACVSCIGEAACLLRRRGTIWATRSDCAFPQNSVERPRSTASCLYFLYGQERGHRVPIVRNVAWNDLVTHIKYLPDDSPHKTLFKKG